MSSGPTLTGQTCIEATKRQYLNFSVTKDDWCSYKGECLSKDLIYDQDKICLFCMHRLPLDIPHILQIYKEKKYESSKDS